MERKRAEEQFAMKPLRTTKNSSLPAYDRVTDASNSRKSQHQSTVENLDISHAKKSTVEHKGCTYHLIPVEIEKEAELGIVIGQVEGDSWFFIDEILPNGMIEMHGVLKEGDYLIQAGVYDITNMDISKALLLIEHAYEEGRKTMSFIAARKEKEEAMVDKKVTPVQHTQQVPSRAQSFTEYDEHVVDDDSEAEDDEVNQTQF